MHPSFQYLMIQQTPYVRRQVRKLLLFICGSKEKYRQLRDLHTLDSHVRGIKKLLEEQGIFLRASVVTASSGSALQYDTLISLVSGGEMGGGGIFGLAKASRGGNLSPPSVGEGAPSARMSAPPCLETFSLSFCHLQPRVLKTGPNLRSGPPRTV